MKRLMITLSFIVLLAGTAVATWTPARAGNSNVEAVLQSFGDVSMFYQALLNTGVINELSENQHYTIFAPINSAFMEIHPQTYPCFYSVQCRPQIAALLRDHIIVGRHDLKGLAKHGQGIATAGPHPVYVQEPYVGNYTVNGKTILSKAEVGGDIVYRINGVIAYPDELAQFQTVNYVPPENTTTTEKTITTHIAPAPQAYPAGTMAEPPAGVPDSVTEKTTIIHTYTTEQ